MYIVVFRPRAKRQFQKFSPDLQHRIRAAITGLAENPRPYGCTKIQNQENRYRIRVGTYRVIYEINDAIITVFVAEIDHRKNIYR